MTADRLCRSLAGKQRWRIPLGHGRERQHQAAVSARDAAARRRALSQAYRACGRDAGRGASAKARCAAVLDRTRQARRRSEEHTSELQSLMRISYAVFCLKKKTHNTTEHQKTRISTY